MPKLFACVALWAVAVVASWCALLAINVHPIAVVIIVVVIAIAIAVLVAGVTIAITITITVLVVISRSHFLYTC